MLRMTQSRSAEQAKDYHNDALLKSDYYLNDAAELSGSSFNGRLAERIGINGPATKFAFDALCENINPVTLKLLTRRKSKVRTVGYDLTFCCPKSVSLLHVFAGDDHILNAFRAAVHVTMKEIEADAKTRVRKNGKDENRVTGELLYADFIHQTARTAKGSSAPDPFLHSHVFTFNCTYDPVENKIKAVQFRDIMRDMPYYESRFHKRLADNLKALGYNIQPTKNSFEVVGIDPAIIRLFSKRTNEIEQFAKEHDITDAKELDKLGARTRAKKQSGLSMDTLKAEWKRQIHALGLQSDFDPVRFSNTVEQSKVTPLQCVDHALLHHFERESVVQDRRILAKAYKFGIAADVAVNQIDDAFNSHQDIIKVQEESRLLCTLKTVLQEEQRLVRLAHDGKNKFTPLYLSPPVMALQDEQANAAAHVLTTADQTVIISGGAGTGKTTLMQETVRLIEATGKKVVVVAPTAQASRGVLRKEGFANAETVAKILASPSLQKDLQDQVLWVDEAGLLGTKDMTALQELACKYNTRVIYSGDVRQHSAVSYGDSLRLLSSVISPVCVNKIHRQRKTEYREAVQDLAQENIKAAFAKIDKMGAIKIFDDNYQSLVKDYMETVCKGKSALVVSPTHAEGEAVTSAIRKTLRHAGKIGEQETAVTRLVSLNLTQADKADGRFYEPGQVLQFNRNWQDIARGEILSVMKVTGNKLVIASEKKKAFAISLNDIRGFDVYRKAQLGLSRGDVISITRNGFDNNKQSLNNGQVLEVISVSKGEITARHPESKAEYILPEQFGHLSYACCVTSHASQGRTVDEVFIAQPSSTFPASNMKQFYVSASRARDRLHIYTDNKAALLDHVSKSGNRISAMELVGHALKSIPFARSTSIN